LILKTVVVNFVNMKITFVAIFSALALSTCGSGRSSASNTEAAFVSAVSMPEEEDGALPVEAEPQAMIEWDKTVHDFGDVSVSDGPLSCSFTLKNVGSEAISIFEVVSSCGCTGVEFPKSRIERKIGHNFGHL